jgi:hypothetical protein
MEEVSYEIESVYFVLFAASIALSAEVTLTPNGHVKGSIAHADSAKGHGPVAP